MELVEEHYSPDITEAAPRSFKRNIKELMQWLQELEEQANTLKKVEKEFLETRDDELLKPFQPNIRLNFVTLKVPIEEPMEELCLFRNTKARFLYCKLSRTKFDLTSKILLRTTPLFHGSP
jgi:hypothetical protein